jgi:L-seryl-tRNA(Ser) seleniumtransferase
MAAALYGSRTYGLGSKRLPAPPPSRQHGPAMSRSPAPLRALPSVDRLLTAPAAADLLQIYARPYVTEMVRATLDAVRDRVRAGAETPANDEILEEVAARLARDAAPRLQRVINATGVVLHTNLGRAALAPAAAEAAALAAGAVNLEYDLESGRRGDRDELIEADLCALSGAEAATVVNNNAAAVLLVLNTLADGREVIVSRGELVEIGGSFRIPEVLAKSGARLREVGTTNRTHRRDYEAALGESTGALLKVHRSNYRIIGFTAEVGLDELVALGRARGVPVIEDLGSGALIDLSTYGLPKEPVVAERLALGADVITFSGDKLLGGPQAGLIVGRRDAVAAIKANPLKRALRCDKLTLAALAATLSLYRRSAHLDRDLPALRWLARPLAEIEAIAIAAVPVLQQLLGPEFHLEVCASRSEIGSGALPGETLETRVIAVTHPQLGADAIARRFRGARPPVIGRIETGRFLLDVRTVERAEEFAVVMRDT